MIRDEIEARLAKTKHPTAFLATVDSDGAPQVRPVTLMVTAGDFYLGTSSSSRKAEQISSDSRVELVTVFCEGENNGYLRVMGNAEPVADKGLIERVTQTTGYPLTDYWQGADDPDFFFCRIKPTRVEYMKPGEIAATEVTDEYIK
jgi:general stress protein 26